MNYPTVATLVQSLHGMVNLIFVIDKSEYEIVLNHLLRWWEPFESFAKFDDSVF